jgi:putative hydrolase of the HAD superfamily
VSATPPRALTADAAGTLIVPHPSVGAVYAEVAARHGYEADAEALERAFPAAFAAVRSRWAVPYGADEDDALRFWAQVIDATFGEALSFEAVCDLYDAFAGGARWRVVAGAREALALARERGLPVAVVSNFDRRLEPLLGDLGLGPFAAVVPSTVVGKAKPDPAPLLEACRRMAVEPGEIVHLGDSEREDGAMCAAVGARWLRVEPGRGVPLEELRAILGGR